MPSDRIIQWGKRPATQPAPYEPPAQTRRTEADSPGVPIMTVQGAAESPFDTLPAEIVREILHHADVSTLAGLASCSWSWTRLVRDLQWERDGSLFDNGHCRAVGTSDTLVHRLQSRWLASCWSLPSLVARADTPAVLQRPRESPDRDIGFQVGCRRGHVSLSSGATPERLAGLGEASRWRSLTLELRHGRWTLSELLTPLMSALDAQPTPLPRELALDIRGPEVRLPLTFPEGFWRSMLELVSVRLADLPDPASVCAELRHAGALRQLSVAMDSAFPVVQVLRALGMNHPQLQRFDLRSSQFAWMYDVAWRDFLNDHPALMAISLDFTDLRAADFRFDVADLRVPQFELSMRYFSDPDGALASWVRESHTLQTLRLVIGSDQMCNPQDLRRLAQAIGANRSIRRLSIEQEEAYEFKNGSFERKQAYIQGLSDWLEPICGNTSLDELTLSMDLLAILDHEGVTESRILRHFEQLESVNPGLNLNVANLCFARDRFQSSSVYQVPVDEFVEQFGSAGIELPQDLSDFVSFVAQTPTWGEGAFRRVVSDMVMDYDDACEYLWSEVQQGSLRYDSLRV